MITSLGAQVKLEQTCFLDNKVSHGIVTLREVEGEDAPIFDGVDVHVTGTQSMCDLVVEEKGGGSVDCGADPDASNCKSSMAPLYANNDQNTDSIDL